MLAYMKLLKIVIMINTSTLFQLTLIKILFNNQYGNLDLQTNFKVQNYDTNKLKSFFINDLNWISNNISFDSGLQGKFLANLKNINYEAKNIEIYKEDVTH